jgi:hypothetical protein
MNATKNITQKDPCDQPPADEAGIGEGEALSEAREWLASPGLGDNDSDGLPEPGQIGPLQQALYFSVLARS